ncbi:nuclear receptor coactivator 5-like isoform X2 [Acropora millepora]|uniref:nuclear receptor coactivator 5-like isoform X2 n=1 Tax=Acropora millepora TaxID=45264 RepID=UPI001CF32E66|nr:nuclear receptor coactivator 5-like isoform X2 [Acropora millepora]
MAANDKRDAKLRDSRKQSPDRWGKHSNATKDTNRNDPHSIRCRVFIGNLPVGMKSKELEETFSQYGVVSGLSIHNNFGFVQFEDEKSADTAVAKENGKVYHGKRVDVNLAGDRRRENMDDRPRERDSRPPFPFNRREREFDRDGRPFRKSPPRERPRFEDYDRFPSRFEPPFDRRGRSPSPPRRMDDRPGYGRHDDYYMRDRYRDEPPHHREPYPRHPFDHRGDPFDRDRREPFDAPRGPYPDRRDDHYDRYDSYNRDYPRPDDYPGPAKKPRMDYNDRPDNMYSSSSKSIEAPTDCVIVVMNKQQRGYAEMVERRLKSVGLVVELHFHGSQPISELLDDVARRGVLYAVVITSQHEIHRSVTVNILHGTPQGKDQNLLARIKSPVEHRNMPLDDAMRLVGQNFDQYMQDLRERAKSSGAQDLDKAKTTAPQNVEKSDVTSLLSKAASGADLSADQLTKLIDDLSKRQQEKMGSSSTTAATNGKGGVSATQSSQPVVDPQSIAKQQADLQAKILSILNPGSGTSSGSNLNSSSVSTQKSVLPGQITSVPTVASLQAAVKTATLSTTAKPIFPLYPAQQKPSTLSVSNASSAARPSMGTTGTQSLSSNAANQAGKPYKSPSNQGSSAASSAYGSVSSSTYQSTKPVAPNTYTVGSNQASRAAAPSQTAYGASQGYSVGTQQTAASSPATSKFSPVGQAASTVGVQRPTVTPTQRMGGPSSGPRPASSATVGQMRAPGPMKRGLLGAAPAGVPRMATSATPARTPSPSGTAGLRMGTPRGPSPMGRAAVRTASPAAIQGQTAPLRGGAITVRGGGTAVRRGVAVGTQGRGIATPPNTAQVRGGLAPRGAAASAASRGGVATRGAPTSRGAPSPRGAPAPRGAPSLRGGPALRGTPGVLRAPAARGAPRGAPAGSAYSAGGRGGPPTQGAPIRAITPGRGPTRGGPVMRGAPSLRRGRGNFASRGGY